MRLIDADELMDFPYSEGAGTEEQIMDWLEECGLSDEEDGAKMLCWKVIEGFRNVVKTASTLPTPQWISVKERLPDVDKTQSGYEKRYVIVATKNGVKPLIFERACVRDKVVRRWKWPWDRRYDGSPVTHWMPLPEPPKEVMKDGKDD